MKSLELNWIRNVDKSLVIPDVMFHVLDNAAGCYMRPQKYEAYDMNGHPHEMRFGLICVNPDYPWFFESVLAHEWRHHWQLHHGMKYDGIGSDVIDGGYNEGAVKYFTESKSELDAVRFQYKHSTIPDLWEELLYDYL